MGPKANDEIDIFEYLVAFWRAKLTILGFMVAAAVAGFGYVATVPVYFTVSSSLMVHLYSPMVQQTCVGSFQCSFQESVRPFNAELGPDWDVSSTGAISLVTDAPRDESVYAAELAKAVAKTNVAILAAAKLELGLIDDLALSPFAALDAIVLQKLYAARAVQMLEAGADAVSVTPPVIARVVPNMGRIVFTSSILGLFAGLAFVLLRRGLKAQKA